MKVRFCPPLGNNREIARPSPSNCKPPGPQTGLALAGRWERAVTSAILRVVSRPTTGAPCTFQSSVLRNVLRTAIRGFPKHLLFYRFDSGEIFVLRVVHGARDLERLS